MKTGPVVVLTYALGVSGCQRDETISGFAGNETVFALESLDDAAAPSAATLAFPEAGRVAGNGPCNAFSAAQSAPYPWIEVGPIAATRRACPDLPFEAAYFDALRAMTLVEVAGPTLILSTPGGRQMVFQARN